MIIIFVIIKIKIKKIKWILNIIIFIEAAKYNHLVVIYNCSMKALREDMIKIGVFLI